LATDEVTKLESLAVEAISHTTRPIEHKAPYNQIELSPQLSKLSLSPIKSISALSAPKGNNTISAITLIVVTEMCGKILMRAKMREVKFKMVWGIGLDC
jgi:hypothetical protein